MITITGLGPGDLDRVPEAVKELLLDGGRKVIIRTRDHPASLQLESLRPVTFCDDLYESSEAFDDVYERIAERVLAASETSDVIYAVPGSPMVGEFAVRRIISSGADFEIIPAESFVDAVLAAVGYDPLDRGLQILNAHDLPDPLVLDKPTIIAHLDLPELLAEVGAQLDRVLPEESLVTVLFGVGGSDGRVDRTRPDAIDHSMAGNRTSIFVDAPQGGLMGAIQTMRLLRQECPWDRNQTHQSLVKNLVEESFELIDAISGLPEDGIDWAAYAAVEDELGDVLLQVLFHSVIAREVGAFDIDDVAEVMRQKLVRRHPHVFGDVEVSSPEEVKANWDRIKKEEEGPDRGDESALAGVSPGMPALQRASKIQNRAAKVGFDWEHALQVLPKVREELDELEAAMQGDGDISAELGDVMFSMVNLSRHLGLDPELSLRGATSRFEDRFRRMEGEGPLDGLGLDSLNERWDRAKER